jgi:MFS family permease
VTFSAVFLNDIGHLSTIAISGSIVTFQIGAAMTRIWSGHFTDRHRNRRRFLKAWALLTSAVFASLGLLVAVPSIAPPFPGAAIPGRRRAPHRRWHRSVDMAWRRLHGIGNDRGYEPCRYGARPRQYLCFWHLLPHAACDTFDPQGLGMAGGVVGRSRCSASGLRAVSEARS